MSSLRFMVAGSSGDRRLQDARDAVQASADLTARDQEGIGILSCSPHVTTWPAEVSAHRAAQSSQPGSGTAAAEPGVTSANASPRSGSNADAGSSEAAHAPQPSAVQRMEEAQRLYMSTACRNPTKKLLCEAPTVQVKKMYDSAAGGELLSGW